MRNYQILDKDEKKEGKDTHLIEIGPRFVLIPIRIFSGSMGGATLYQNAAYVSPNAQRAEILKGKGDRYKKRVEDKIQRKTYDEENKMPVDELSTKRVFA